MNSRWNLDLAGVIPLLGSGRLRRRDPLLRFRGQPVSVGCQVQESLYNRVQSLLYTGIINPPAVHTCVIKSLSSVFVYLPI